MRFFPLLLIAVIVYNILAFGTGSRTTTFTARSVPP